MPAKKRSGTLSAEAKRARAAYQKQWREQNPEKQGEYVRRYWEKKAMKSGGGDDHDGKKRVSS